jgi:20S proteasome subunit beta 1
VDATFKEKMTKAQCLDFTKNAVTLAIQRDGSSGGVVRTVAISKDGVEHSLTLNQDLPKFNGIIT